MTKKNETELQIAEVKKKADNMQGIIATFEIKNDEDLGKVADYVKNVKLLKGAIEDQKEKFVSPAKEIIASAKSQYDPLIAKCVDAEKTLKAKASTYMLQKQNEEAEAKAKLAARVEKGTMKPETAMKKMEAMPEVQSTVRTDTGSGLRMSKRKVAKITDPSVIPDEYWIVDETRVKKDALDREKNGQQQIPGVEIEEVTTMSSV